MDFVFCLFIDFAVFWLVWSLSLLLFIQHGTNKELVPVHSTEDRFMPDTKWDRDCCAATVSELPMAWTVFKPHQVQRKEMISWYTLGYTPLSTLTLTWKTTNRLCACFASLYFPSYRTLVRPVYRVTYRKITSLEWRCCPGFHGEDCREGEGAHFLLISSSLKHFRIIWMTVRQNNC